MGDFEDIFGAGADIDAIIDGICADEDRHDKKDDVIEHRLWFPDYATAEAWEKAHRSVGFTRRRHQGGFEVILRDLRSTAELWRSSSMPDYGSDRGGAHEMVTLVHAEGLSGHEIKYGSYSVRLASQTSSMLAGFLLRLRHEVPPARAAMSPIGLPTKQFREFFRSMPTSMSHEIDMGLGVMAVFCEDHHLLIGRRIGKDEIRLWPWILEMDCGGGKVGSDGNQGCFICDHHEVDGYIRSDTHYDSEAFNCRASEGHRHYVAQGLYAGDARPRDLARCVTDWIALLAPFDAQMNATRRAPSSVIAMRK